MLVDDGAVLVGDGYELVYGYVGHDPCGEAEADEDDLVARTNG